MISKIKDFKIMAKKMGYCLPVTLKNLNDLHLSYNCYINSIHSFFTILQVKFNFITFFDVVDQAAYMYESFFVRIVMFNKTETFFRIEKFNGTEVFVVHFKFVLY